MTTTSQRLKDQGLINHHRKTAFRLAAVVLLAYLFYMPIFLPIPPAAMLWVVFAGTLLLFVGVVGRMFATISIGGHKDSKVVQTEVYSITRNPLYFSSFLMAIGLGLISLRVDFLVLLCVAYLLIFYPMMKNEARYLQERFEDYAEYEKRVPLFFPKFSLWTSRDHFEVNFRLLKRTLRDASVALLVVPVLLAAYLWH